MKLKGIHCDNGTEFKNSTLNYFCAGKGVLKHYSSAVTPQQNGVVEKHDKTLIEAAITLLCDSKLPLFFWAEAPIVAHFRAFGCPCTLLNLESTPKFGAKADDCYFVGYTGRTAYKIYNKTTKQTVESYDVRWLEENETDARVGSDSLLDYNELFKPFNVFPVVDAENSGAVARIEDILIFLAYASYMGFTIYQMDVKTTFMYGEVKEEIYVDQPPGFVDSNHPTYVYKLEKALYGLLQEPRAWFEQYVEYQDANMWVCIQDGYIPPTTEFEGREQLKKYNTMEDDKNKMYKAESKALAAITMAMPQENLHTF
ncbi:uncharacterized protein LOC143578029 [Bidens hawaiensis]|uniref:uncharacterized protein LOC143578029 n=1 Tax=Bidens hawaiensis TaxID=980011 RepID=UPI00404A71D1